MDKITEFDLVQALWDCSCYVRDLPTKEESRAIKAVVSSIFSRWVAQQEISDDARVALIDQITSDGPVAKAASKALKQRYESDTHGEDFP